MIKFLLGLLSISSSFLHTYNIGNYSLGENISVSYVERFPLFPTSSNESHIIQEVYGMSNCEISCNSIESCVGYTYFDSRGKCHLLNSTGDEGGFYVEGVKSFKKEVYHLYLKNHTLSGFVYFTQNSHNREVVYVDMNHNNNFDRGEPYNYTDDDGYFEINGLEDGMYAVKLLTPPECYELYPGRYGVSLSYRGEGYFDFVRYFYPYNQLRGGTVDGTEKDVSMDFILNEDNNTYLTFQDGNIIVLGMLDDIIVNGTGSDIFFNTYGETSLSANVSSSYDGRVFYQIGILNNTHKDFDINLTQPMRYVKLDFFETEVSSEASTMSIRNIRSKGRVYYNPGFLYYVPVPEDDLLFIVDCTYYYRCGTFCDFYVNPYQARSSCRYGCQYFDDSSNCECQYDETSNFVYGEFNRSECKSGCEYALSKKVYPDYKVYFNSRGLEEDTSHTYTDLDYSISYCSDERYCLGISFSDNSDRYSIQDSFRFKRSDDSYFLAKNSVRRGLELDYMTTTPSSTMTTTPSSTMTTTPSSTMTTTPSSTMTTTPSSTMTTTPSSTMTTTPSSTMTTTPSSTMTTTPSSTMTTTPSSTIQIQDTGGGISQTTIAVVSVLSFLVLIVGYIGVRYYQITRKESRISPAIQNTSFTNPVYDNGYFDPSLDRENHDYSDVFPQDMDTIEENDVI